MGPRNVRLSCRVTNDNSHPFLTLVLVNVQCTNAGSCSLNSLNEEINPFRKFASSYDATFAGNGSFFVCCIFISLLDVSWCIYELVTSLSKVWFVSNAEHQILEFLSKQTLPCSQYQ